MVISHRKSKKKAAASKPMVEKKEAVVTPQVTVEEEQPIVRPSYKIVSKPFLTEEEDDINFENEEE